MITPSEFELYIVRKVARNPHLINETHDSVCLDNSYHRSVTDDQKQILASLHTDHATCTYENCRVTQNGTDTKLEEKVMNMDKTISINDNHDNDDGNSKREKKGDEEDDSLESSSSSSSVFLEPTFVPTISSTSHQTNNAANASTNEKNQETLSTLQFSSVPFNTLLQRAIVDNAIAPVGGVHIVYELLWAPYVRAIKIAKQIYNLKKELQLASCGDAKSVNSNTANKQGSNVKSNSHMQQELNDLEHECDSVVKELKDNMVNIKVRIGALERMRNIHVEETKKENEEKEEELSHIEHEEEEEWKNHKDAQLVGEAVVNSTSNANYKRERSN